MKWLRRINVIFTGINFGDLFSKKVPKAINLLTTYFYDTLMYIIEQKLYTQFPFQKLNFGNSSQKVR